jgi:hypothetical protein
VPGRSPRSARPSGAVSDGGHPAGGDTPQRVCAEQLIRPARRAASRRGLGWGRPTARGAARARGSS